MKKGYMNLLFIILLFTAGCGQHCNELTDQELAEGWELLFDGQNLDNWKNYNSDQAHNWIIEGESLASGGFGMDSMGYLITVKEYGNFELRFEWKIAPGGNSAVLYHVIESEQYKTPCLTGPAYSLLDDEGFPGEFEEWQKTGADYAMQAPEAGSRQLNPPGEWNSSRIIFDNGHVEHWLNGEKILTFESWSPEWFRLRERQMGDAQEYGLSSTGHICLLDHGSKVWFRNMKIRELPGKERPPVELFNGENLDGWIAYGTEKWYVENGLLVCESGPDKGYGYLATEMYYKDFDLSLDFKQISNGNSGVFFRSTVEGTRVSGWQVEVAPKGSDTGGIYESYGRGWLNRIPDEKEGYLKEGEWNTMRIKVTGGEVTTWLNGHEMTRLTDDAIGKANGRIALQIHDGGGIKVQWKNIVIQPL